MTQKPKLHTINIVIHRNRTFKSCTDAWLSKKNPSSPGFMAKNRSIIRFGMSAQPLKISVSFSCSRLTMKRDGPLKRSTRRTRHQTGVRQKSVRVK